MKRARRGANKPQIKRLKSIDGRIEDSEDVEEDGNNDKRKHNVPRGNKNCKSLTPLNVDYDERLNKNCDGQTSLNVDQKPNLNKYCDGQTPLNLDQMPSLNSNCNGQKSLNVGYNSHRNKRSFGRLPLEQGFGFNSDSCEYFTPRRNEATVPFKFREFKSIRKTSNLPAQSKALSKSDSNIQVTPAVSSQMNHTDLDTRVETDTLDSSDEDIARNKSSASYPPPKMKGSVHLNDDDLEMDIIVPEKLEEKQLDKAPDNVDGAFSSMKPKEINAPLISFPCIPVDILVIKKRPVGETLVKIQHLENANLVLDDFGALVKTYRSKTPDGHEYFRHIFGDILPDTPAKFMKIRKGCELVLINGVFAPDLNHDSVMRIFKDVKVDGETRFELVVRYVDEKEHEKTWIWFETSAILDDTIPNHEHGGDYPAVEDEHFEVLPGNQAENQMICRLRIKNTKKFIVIGDDEVTFSLTPSNLIVNARYKQDPTGYVTFTASICDIDKKHYISASGNTVKIGHDPYWFGMQQIGNDFEFRSDDEFLVYDIHRNTLTTSKSKQNCQFEKIPSDDYGLDEIDPHTGPSTSYSDYGTQNASSKNEYPINDDKADQETTMTAQATQEIENDEIPTQINDAASKRSWFYSSSKGSSYQTSLNVSFQSSSRNSSFQSSSQESSFQSSSLESSLDETRSTNDITMMSSTVRSSGYLTSNSFDDINLEGYCENKPKTPNTPMECLNIGDQNIGYKKTENNAEMETVI